MNEIFCSSMIKLSNRNFLVGYKDKNNKNGLTEYKYEKETFIKINSVKGGKLFIYLCVMKDGKISSLSGKRKIKIWPKI